MLARRIGSLLGRAIGDWLLVIGDWGLEIGDWGLEIGDEAEMLLSFFGCLGAVRWRSKAVPGHRSPKGAVLFLRLLVD